MANLQLQNDWQEGQVCPSHIDALAYDTAEKQMLTEIEKSGLSMDLFASALNPYPFVVSSQRLADLKRFQDVLRRAIKIVVEHYFIDERISRIISLSPDERDLLLQLSNHPYRLGGIRPDFLFAENGDAVIAEINGRFPLNGFISSYLLTQHVPALFRGLAAIPAMKFFPEALRQRLKGKTTILKSKEAGWDVHLLSRFIGGDVNLIDPIKHPIDASHLSKNVVLELHQQELFTCISSSLRQQLTQHPGLLNDLRTILIAHDKRLLCVLSTTDILHDYLAHEDVVCLRRHLIPSWTKVSAPEKFVEAAEHPHGWLAKPPRSGKGDGIFISDTMTPSEWRLCLQNMDDDCLLQPYVVQKKFRITLRKNGNIVSEDMRVVGLLPMLDDESFGCGMFRAASGQVVNVASGGVILAPAIRESEHA